MNTGVLIFWRTVVYDPFAETLGIISDDSLGVEGILLTFIFFDERTNHCLRSTCKISQKKYTFFFIFLSDASLIT